MAAGRSRTHGCLAATGSRSTSACGTERAGMFTGIITDIGTIRGIEQRGDLRAVIETAYETDTVDLGASIACSGGGLTVVDKGPGWFAVDISGETVSRAASGQWQQGN